ncbi:MULTISPECIES: patatin-like phospholipase family protein [Thiorhodovibrio]|uniref:patatin-like phospholipase family protein n=1 Tax=Thiorhodovibrio TaxID=61593 RepID=UPI001913A6F6|nr:MULTISPECIES: patatin-like phospholipase family protein [Thiorhodovibrio]MBK5967282.1 patatin [Thiorhodovibrio winogradskyi]WPL14465.1 NTE family protein RssA [Thiorhodovibrio litoralis]
MPRRLLLSFVLFTVVSAALAPSPGRAAATAKHPRIGLVLAGGGAKGAAHIGVLKVLEELRIPIHAIAGTSMGSLVGGAYAAGLSAQELGQRVLAVDWNEMFDDNPPRSQWPARRQQASLTPAFNFSIGVRDGKAKLPPGAIAGQKVQLFFNDLLQGVETTQNFDALPIRFRAVATNLENGEMVVFDHGPLPVAMRASMAVPGVFAPMVWEDHIYVDGGLVRNLPVDVARSMGVDHLIVVNLGSSFLPRDQLDNILGITGQMIAILTEQNVQVSLAEIDPKRDLLIVPDLGDIGSSDFDRAAEAIATGVTAAQKSAGQLRRFSLSEKEYAAWKRERFGRSTPVTRVSEVRVLGLKRVNEALFDPLIDAQENQAFDRERLELDIQHLYGRGDFERISYRFEPDPAGKGEVLIVDAVEKAWGPGYLGFGLKLSSDNKGDSRFGLRATYQKTWMNRLGAEWFSEIELGNEPRLYSEWFQPLDLDHSGFVAPYLDLKQTPYSVFDGDQRVARYDVTRAHVGADFGLSRSNLELRLGPYWGITNVNLDTGSRELPEGDQVDSGVRASLSYDTLDRAAVPRAGQRLKLEARAPLTALGADSSYARTLFTAFGAHTSGPNTLAVHFKAGTSFGVDMPYYDQFPLGGFLKLSGYANEQFRGNDMVFGSLAYYRQIATLPTPLGRGLFLGASLEAGWLPESRFSNGENLAFDLAPEGTRFGSSVFFGSDTWIGPAYLGLGLSASGDHALYVLIGRPD